MDPKKLLEKIEQNTDRAYAFGRAKPSFYFNDAKNYSDDIGDVFGENGNENWSHFQKIYKRIDENLMFDSLLAQYNHFGKVYVQFKVSENGILDLRGLTVDSSDVILKVHVLRAIRKSLSEPLDDIDKSRLFVPTVFQAQFNFRYGDHNNNFDKQDNFGRPVFVFSRYTTEKPVPRELLDHLLSGGVTPNVSLMYERWKKFNKMKRLDAIKFDPFENYRRDNFYSL